MTNGKESICISKETGKNINSTIEHYTKVKNETENVTVTTTSFMAGNIVVYKSEILQDNNTVHYWYEDNGNVYSIFTWNKSPNSDQIVSELIKSKSFALF